MEEGKAIAVEIVNRGLSIMDFVSISGVLIALIAVLASFVSNLQTRKSNKITRESNEILLRQYDRSLPRITIKSIKHETLKDDRKKYFSIGVEISNQSENANSIKLAELHISKRRSDHGGKLVIQGLKELSLKNKTHTSGLPVQLDSGMTIENTFYFFVDEEILKSFHVDEYQIVLTDTFGNTFSDRFFNLRGVDDFE